MPNIEVFSAIEPVYPLMVDEQPFPSEKDVDAPIAVANTCGSIVSDLHSQELLLIPVPPIVEGRSTEADYRTRTADTHSVDELQIFLDFAPL